MWFFLKKKKFNVNIHFCFSPQDSFFKQKSLLINQCFADKAVTFFKAIEIGKSLKFWKTINPSTLKSSTFILWTFVFSFFPHKKKTNFIPKPLPRFLLSTSKLSRALKNCPLPTEHFNSIRPVFPKIKWAFLGVAKLVSYLILYLIALLISSFLFSQPSSY